MQIGIIIRGAVALAAIFGVQLSEDVIAALEQHTVAVASGVLALWGLWPVLVAAWRAARGQS